jgi:hypothetical protein
MSRKRKEGEGNTKGIAVPDEDLLFAADTGIGIAQGGGVEVARIDLLFERDYSGDVAVEPLKSRGTVLAELDEGDPFAARTR